MKLRCLVPDFYIHVSVSDLYAIGPHILLEQNRCTDVETGNAAAKFIPGNTSIGSCLQCVSDALSFSPYSRIVTVPDKYLRREWSGDGDDINKKYSLRDLIEYVIQEFSVKKKCGSKIKIWIFSWQYYRYSIPVLSTENWAVPDAYCTWFQAIYEQDPVAAIDRCKEFMTNGTFQMVRKAGGALTLNNIQ